jgi:hypothetical protein
VYDHPRARASLVKDKAALNGDFIPTPVPDDGFAGITAIGRKLVKGEPNRGVRARLRIEDDLKTESSSQ